MKYKELFDTDYPAICALDKCHIHISGKRLIELEGFRSVSEYNTACATFNMGGFNLCVKGEGLLLKALGKPSLLIEGDIRSLEFVVKGSTPND